MSQVQRINPASQLAILLGIWGFCFIAGNIVVIPIWKAMTGVSLLSDPSAMFNPTYSDANKVVQVTSSFIAFALPALVFAKLVGKYTFSYLRFNTHANWVQLFICVVIITAGILASGALAELNQRIPIPKSWAASFQALEDQSNKVVLAMSNMKTVKDYILSLLIIALSAALFEELLFRGALQQVIVGCTKNIFWGILITSILFSLVHLSFYGFLPRLFLGMVLGYIFQYGKNIWLNIFIHFGNNAIIVTSMFVLSRQGKLTEQALNDSPSPLYIGLFALVVVIAALLFFKRESRKLQDAAVLNTENSAFNIH